jgi:hypothetical protein
MSNRISTLVRCTFIGAALTLAACQRSETEQRASLANEITGNQADPALTSALEDPILTDPALSQQSNRNAVRPSNEPVQAQYPTASVETTSAGHREMAKMANGEGKICGAPLQNDMAWSRRLPPAFPLLPGARVTDAAGNNVGACRGRVIAFTSNAAPERVIDWYRERAARAGYSAEHQRQQNDYILAGANGGSGGAYYLIVTPRDRGGSQIALIANRGG